MQGTLWHFRYLQVLYAQWEAKRKVRKYKKMQTKGVLPGSEYNSITVPPWLKLSGEFCVVDPHLSVYIKGSDNMKIFC